MVISPESIRSSADAVKPITVLMSTAHRAAEIPSVPCPSELFALTLRLPGDLYFQQEAEATSSRRLGAVAMAKIINPQDKILDKSQYSHWEAIAACG